jgi:hypothetical protein
MHLGSLLTGKFKRNWEFLFYRLHQIYERFDSMLAGVWNPLGRQLGRYLRLRSVDPGSLKQGDRDRHLVLAIAKGGHVDTLNRAYWHFSATLINVFFSVIFPQL